jgi:hypothetical protein
MGARARKLRETRTSRARTGKKTLNRDRGRVIEHVQRIHNLSLFRWPVSINNRPERRRLQRRRLGIETGNVERGQIRCNIFKAAFLLIPTPHRIEVGGRITGARMGGQAANVILMRPHNWERFSFGASLLKAAPRLHRNKLATALANKLARIAWSILRNEQTFDLNRHQVMAI